MIHELKIINLSGIKLCDINIFEKVNFKELKELYLNDNELDELFQFLFALNILSLSKFSFGLVMLYILYGVVFLF